MRLLKDFRDFALKGNVVDLAVGVIIGVAFGAIVTSLVNDVLMPPIGKVVGNLDFSNLYVSLSDKIDEANKTKAATQPSGSGGASRLPLEDARKLGAVIAYGKFITAVINFIIVAFCIFLLVKLMLMAKKQFEKEQAAAPPPPEIALLTEIRDLLKQQQK